MIESILALPRHPFTADVLMLLYEDYSLLEDGVSNVCGCIYLMRLDVVRWVGNADGRPCVVSRYI